MREAFDELQRATDPTISTQERYKANQRLENFWGPAMNRRATAPEKFALRLQPAAEQLSVMIGEHLSNVKGAHRHRVASDVVRRLQGQISSIRQLTKQNNGRPLDDFILGVAAPLIFPPTK
jgi:hypothetical protein